MSKQSAYAKAGVDYTKIEPFKHAMIEAGKKTITFPNKRGVYINSDVLHSHGGVFEYRGAEKHLWCNTQEGLGNKNWIAEWMYQYAGTGKTYYGGIGIDAALMAVNDVIAQGAMPVVYTDEVAAGDSEWFADEKRAKDLATGFLKVCEEAGMALPAGESPALKYLVKAEPPVKSAPSLSGCVTAIIAPTSRLITGTKLAPGDAIIGVTSSGIHANGISLIIKKALELPDKFMTKLPNGNTLGEETLIPTRSYVGFVEALLEAKVDIHALLPGTGSGVAKIAFDSRPATYRVHTWTAVPPLFQFMQSIGVSLEDCLKTFNWGIGYYAFVAAPDVERVLAAGKKAGYDVLEVGRVEEGERQVIFEPEKITLPPPGE
ncbi:MAG TPA: AIR synthase-related protein [Candidatus Paceibacterota bacterium]|nr:AIR synthase-related protein [Candidatus Paceibacterota bacterium]